MAFFLRLRRRSRRRPGALHPPPGPLAAQPAPGARPTHLPGVVELLEERAAAASRRPGAAARTRRRWPAPTWPGPSPGSTPTTPRSAALARRSGRWPWPPPGRAPHASRRGSRRTRTGGGTPGRGAAVAPDEPRSWSRSPRTSPAAGGSTRRCGTTSAPSGSRPATQRRGSSTPSRSTGRAREPRGARAAETAALLPTSQVAVAERRGSRGGSGGWRGRLALPEGGRAPLRRRRGARFARSAPLDRENVDGAVALLAEGPAARPGHLDGVLRLADLLAATGGWRRPRRGSRRRCGSRPARPRPGSAAAGRAARGEGGRGARDLPSRARARAAAPGLKDRVRSLEPKREPYETPYALDALALAKAPDDGAPDDDAVVLGEVQVTRVFPSGLASTWRQEWSASGRRAAPRRGGGAPSPTRRIGRRWR